MNVIIIPDMHGSHNWEKAIEIHREHPDYYVVALGDWVDSWHNYWPDQGDNLKKALDWFREDKEHRFFLIGNHDWAYISNGSYGDTVSGHQSKYEATIKHILNTNKDIINVAKEIDGCVFSHAGFTKTWLHEVSEYIYNKSLSPEEKRKMIEDAFNGNDTSVEIPDISIDEINKLFQNRFNERDEHLDGLLDWHGMFSSTGDEPMQGPLWVRPGSLLKDAAFEKQIVGHTELVYGSIVRLKRDEKRVVLTDSGEYDNVFVLNTKKLGRFFTSDEMSRKMKRLVKAVNDIRSQNIENWEQAEEKIKSAGITDDKVLNYWKDKLGFNNENIEYSEIERE